MDQYSKQEIKKLCLELATKFHEPCSNNDAILDTAKAFYNFVADSDSLPTDPILKRKFLLDGDKLFVLTEFQHAKSMLSPIPYTAI